MRLNQLERPPCVLFVAAMGGLGGPVRRLATLLSRLDDVERVLVKPRSPLLDHQLLGAKSVDEYRPLKRSAQRNRLGAIFIAVAIFRRALSRRRPVDVIHANGLVEFALCWPAAALLRKPVVTWVGNYESPTLVKRFHKIFLPVARRTSWNAVSSFAAEVVAESGLARRDEVKIVTNIIDPVDVGARSRKLDDGNETERIVRVGYLQVARWEKGFDLLAPIFEQLVDLEGRVRLQIYGSHNDQPGWDELERLPDKLVQLRPRTATVGDIYQECDIILSPSRRESFNRVVAEALTTGTPVVATDLAPVREVVGDCGLLFPSEDVVTAAAHIRRLVEDAVLLKELGTRGRARAIRWSPEPVAAEFRRQYGSAV